MYSKLFEKNVGELPLLVYNYIEQIKGVHMSNTTTSQIHTTNKQTFKLFKQIQNTILNNKNLTNKKYNQIYYSNLFQNISIKLNQSSTSNNTKVYIQYNKKLLKLQTKFFYTLNTF